MQFVFVMLFTKNIFFRFSSNCFVMTVINSKGKSSHCGRVHNNVRKTFTYEIKLVYSDAFGLRTCVEYVSGQNNNSRCGSTECESRGRTVGLHLCNMVKSWGKSMTLHTAWGTAYPDRSRVKKEEIKRENTQKIQRNITVANVSNG